MGDLGGGEGAVVGEVFTGGNSGAVDRHKFGVKALVAGGDEMSGQIPVVGGDEGHAFAFTFNNKAGCHGLHATCG